MAISFVGENSAGGAFGISTGADGITQALPWYSGTIAGNLLIACLAFTAVSEYPVTTISPGWTRATGLQSGAVQVEVWYKKATGGNSGPAFRISNTSLSYYIYQAEFSGILWGEPDVSGTTSNSGSLTITPTVSSTTTVDGGLVFGWCLLGMTSSTSYGVDATGAGGGATFDSDIHSDGGTTSESGLDVSAGWAVGGSSGNSPSMTFTATGVPDQNMIAAVVAFKEGVEVSSDKTLVNINGGVNIRPAAFSPGVAR